MMAATTPRGSDIPFGGYHHRQVPEPELDLTQVGPGTPGGEYLRRFWHPVGKSSELLDLPRPIRIMDEELVLFRTGNGEVGLLALHCPHRGTSLEYGLLERRGIRCCYHGWMMAPDGRVIDTPGEPADSPLKDRVYTGAYPTREYRGLVFAYLGPPEEIPDFPIFDTFDLPGYRLVPTGGFDERNTYACNWLQIKENSMDPLHRLYLHDLEDARAELNQFRPSASGASLDTWL
jgi:phenylpropionate dioxygenase-like ring-hydroxylating dioxygenase large terminal subunit